MRNAILAALTVGLIPVVAQAQQARCVPGELLVVYAESAKANRKLTVQNEHGLSLLSASPSGIHRYRWDAYDASAAAPEGRYQALLQQAARVRTEPGIRFAEPNYKRYINQIPNDPLYSPNQQWHFEAITLPAAWDITVGSEDIIVALVDTGVLLDHPDLAGRLVPGYDFITNIISANDGDGMDDDPDDPGDSTFPGGSSFHGTHTAGIVGALSDNGFGVAGVTWNCKIMPLRALGVQGGTIADIVEAMLFAGGLPNASGTVPDQPAHVLNLSLGGFAGEAESAIERAAIQDLVAAGVTVIAAAGNQGSSLPAPPASYPETISVGAVDASLGRASYSNFGSTIDVVAPGGQIFNDDNDDGVPDGVFSTLGDDSSGSIENIFGFFQGTSMACPHVAGVVALMLSLDADLTPDEIRDILTSTALDLGDPGRDDEFGFGLIDAAAALTAPCSEDTDCDDGLFCNGAETCAAGDCQSGADPCPREMCNEGSDQCGDCLDDGDCADAQFPFCTAGACVECEDNSDCIDSLFCNGTESCDDGDCQSGADPCPGEMCDESSDECVECLSNGDCDDGLFCNGTESCTAGGDCQSGVSPCPGEICIESSDQCAECLDESDCADPQLPFCTAGACVECEDNSDCVDTLFCNGAESCDANRDCQSSADACPGEMCDESSEECVECLDDGDCSDGLFCNGAEVCNANGDCQSSADACPGEMCDESSDECMECSDDSECDDGLFCNGAEFCLSGVCQDGSAPCIAGQTCNDVTNSCESSVSLNVNLFGDRTLIVPPGTGVNDRVVLTVTVTNPGTRNLTDVELHIEYGADMQAVDKSGAGVLARQGGVPVGFTWIGADLAAGGTVLQQLTARLSPDLSDQEITQLIAADIMLTATARFQGVSVGSRVLLLDIAPGADGGPPDTGEEPPPPIDDTCGCNGANSPMAGMILLGLFFMKRGLGRRRSRQ